MNRAIIAAFVGALVLPSCASSQHKAMGLASQERLDPAELAAWGRSAQVQAGTSAVAGIQTGTLKGSPTGEGVYTIVLRVPANTRIEAHSHPDDRVATVISGTWQIGYGETFDEAKLKVLPPGSFYTEPPDTPHFARTTDSAVVVLITGYGPTGTRYMNEGADPRKAGATSAR
jgi:uncharacterized RmlC-like cupin family protein